jgi:hypothetical protein
LLVRTEATISAMRAARAMSTAYGSRVSLFFFFFPWS